MEFALSDSLFQQRESFGEKDSSSINLLDIVSIRTSQSTSQASQILKEFRDLQNPESESEPDTVRPRIENHAPVLPRHPVDRMAETLPDHQVTDVVKLLAQGVVSGRIDHEQLARAMKIFTNARDLNDTHNLPQVTKDDGLFTILPPYEGRLYKATNQFNNELIEKYGVAVAFINGNVVISNREYPQTHIVVKMDGALSAFQGRPGHRAEYKPMKLEDAISKLKRGVSK